MEEPRRYFGAVWGPGNNMTVMGTTVTVSTLIPGTRYHFQVSAIAPTGRGAERSIFESTQFYHGEALMHHVVYLKMFYV